MYDRFSDQSYRIGRFQLRACLDGLNVAPKLTPFFGRRARSGLPNDFAGLQTIWRLRAPVQSFKEASNQLEGSKGFL